MANRIWTPLSQWFVSPSDSVNQSLGARGLSATSTFDVGRCLLYEWDYLGWTTADLVCVYAPDNSNSGSVALAVDTGCSYVVGDVANSGGTTPAPTVVVSMSGVTHQLAQVTVGTISMASTGFTCVQFGRRGSHASDTYTAEFNVVALYFERAS